MLLYLVIAAITLLCAVEALRAPRLLLNALWLAGASAATALLLYLLGAPEVAVIELSVGTGLVTVLLVLAITVTGRDDGQTNTLVPAPLIAALALISVLLLGIVLIPGANTLYTPAENNFSAVVWQQRGLDMLAQVALMFAGIIGVLALLSETRRTSSGAKQNAENEKPAQYGERETA
ncbi:MAG: DUF4040 domain-containing protein [Chloroflexi bacterium]|nr:DUF4040 domain-containing protein [Chloroflexota bacterium]